MTHCVRSLTCSSNVPFCANAGTTFSIGRTAIDWKWCCVHHRCFVATVAVAVAAYLLLWLSFLTTSQFSYKRSWSPYVWRHVQFRTSDTTMCPLARSCAVSRHDPNTHSYAALFQASVGGGVCASGECDIRCFLFIYFMFYYKGEYLYVLYFSKNFCICFGVCVHSFIHRTVL